MLEWDGELIKLICVEYEMLVVFVMNLGEIFSCECLLCMFFVCWVENFDLCIVDVLICCLRYKFSVDLLVM